MRLLNRREQESIRNMLLDLVDAYKAGDMTLRNREWKINTGVNGELMPLAYQMMLHTLLLYNKVGYEETVKTINRTCDNLGKLSIDKDGNVNISAEEFVKMCND